MLLSPPILVPSNPKQEFSINFRHKRCILECSAGKNSGSGLRNRAMSKFGQKIDYQYPVFFRLDNSNEAKSCVKISSNNRNVKNVMSRFKILTKNLCPYLVFSKLDEFAYSAQTNAALLELYFTTVLSLLWLLQTPVH